MRDIVERLRNASGTFDEYGIHSSLELEAADLIQSLREKTQYWPDNAERDAVIRYQKEEIERLREWNAEIALNARIFAEALREIAKYEIEEGCTCNACRHSALARAALNPAKG